MKDRSDDSSHHERTILPRSYISLQRKRGTHIQREKGEEERVELYIRVREEKYQHLRVLDR